MNLKKEDTKVKDEGNHGSKTQDSMYNDPKSTEHALKSPTSLLEIIQEKAINKDGASIESFTRLALKNQSSCQSGYFERMPAEQLK